MSSSALLGESIDTINVAEKILLRQSQLRITIKTILHRLMAMFITFGFGYFFFRKNFKKAIMFSLLVEFSQFILYFITEFAWNSVPWGYEEYVLPKSKKANIG